MSRDSDNSGERKRPKIEMPEFSGGRKKVVLEVGPGGPTSLVLPGADKYLKDNDFNYVGIDIDGMQHTILERFISTRKAVDWAASLQGSIYDFVDGSSDQVWVRNFRGLGSNEALEKSLFSKISNVLKSGGTALIINTYDEVTKAARERMENELKKQELGLKVEVVDLMTDTHPLIAGQRDVSQRFGINDFMFGDIASGKRGFGFKVTKQ